MPGETNDPDRFSPQRPQSLFERTLVAEYLLSQGYLMPDLQVLPLQEEERLMKEAIRFAGFRLAEIECGETSPLRIRPVISLN
jgi:hypothetical protein